MLFLTLVLSLKSAAGQAIKRKKDRCEAGEKRDKQIQGWKLSASAMWVACRRKRCFMGSLGLRLAWELGPEGRHLGERRSRGPGSAHLRQVRPEQPSHRWATMGCGACPDAHSDLQCLRWIWFMPDFQIPPFMFPVTQAKLELFNGGSPDKHSSCSAKLTWLQPATQMINSTSFSLETVWQSLGLQGDQTNQS